MTSIKKTSLGISLSLATIFSVNVACIDTANAMGIMNPANPLSPLNPAHQDIETAEERAERKARAAERKKRKAERHQLIAAQVKGAIADGDNDAQDIKAAFTGKLADDTRSYTVEFFNLDLDDINFIDQCRKDILGSQFADANAHEVTQIIDCMHEKDYEQKMDTLINVSGSIAGLAALAVGFAAFRRKKPSVA